jgi:hypothetical protein
VKRLCCLLLGLLLVTAAGPMKYQPEVDLPVPPIPPAHPPLDQSAPIPDVDAAGPLSSAVLPNVTLQDFRATQFDQSLGYAPGSKFSTSEDKRSIQTPGLTWKVPLQ